MFVFVLRKGKPLPAPFFFPLPASTTPFFFLARPSRLFQRLGLAFTAVLLEQHVSHQQLQHQDHIRNGEEIERLPRERSQKNRHPLKIKLEERERERRPASGLLAF